MRIVFHFTLAIVLFWGTTNMLWAQKKGSSPDNCRLDEAKKWYEEGELEKIEEIENCAADPKSMSREKRIEALQLITESYLYRNKIGKADKSYRKLLTVNPLHEVDSTDETNSWDLVYLSRTFSRRPIFSIYAAAGINFSLIEMLENYGVDNTSATKPAEGYLDDKNIRIGGNLGLGIEVPLIYGFDLALEANFAYRNHYFYDSLFMSVNPTNPTGGTPEPNTPPNVRDGIAGKPLLYSHLSYTENQFWIDLPLILKYNIVFKKLHPYIYLGGGPNFLLHADMTNVGRKTIRDIPGGGKTLNPPAAPIPLTAHENERNLGTQIPTMRTMINWSLIAGAGVKFRVDRHFLFVDFRYTRMFLNNVERQNRYANQDLIYRYAHIDNDYRTDNFALTFGFMGAFYTPRKKQEFNPMAVDNKFNRWLEKERKNIKKETDEELKSELNSTIKELEREKPSLIEDVQRGRVGSEILKDKKAELEKLKNK